MNRATKVAIAILSIVTLARLSRVFIPNRDPTHPVSAPERIASKHQLVEGKISKVEAEQGRIFLEGGPSGDTAVAIDPRGTKIHRAQQVLKLEELHPGDRAIVRWNKGQSAGAPIDIDLISGTSSAAR